MVGTITEESMKLIADEIIGAVEFTNSREIQLEMIQTILQDNGIVKVIQD